MHPSVLLHFFHEWINMGGGEFALHLLMKLGEKLMARTIMKIWAEVNKLLAQFSSSQPWQPWSMKLS